MRIALVSMEGPALEQSASAPLSGFCVGELARAFARAGHSVDVFVRRADLWSPNVQTLAPGAELVRVPAGPPHGLDADALLPLAQDFATRLVACAAARGPYDIVHASHFLAGAGAARLRKRFGIPFVLTCHRFRGPHAVGRGARAEAVLAAADRVIATSEAEREVLTTLYGVNGTRVEIVPFGVDTVEYRPVGASFRTHLGLRSDEFVIMAVGADAPGDGVEDAIRVLGQLWRTHRIRAQLVVATRGGEPTDVARLAERDRLRALALGEGVASQLRFADCGGRIGAEHYCSADALVAPWHRDATARPALEAMACGLPVVASGTGAVPHAVADAVTGFVVPPDDVPALAERLARLAANRELGRAYGRAGIRRMRAGFTWGHVAGQLVGVYAGILAPSGSRLARIVSGG
jgi:glycosyltransferase involved in cell wall biosynthesis